MVRGYVLGTFYLGGTKQVLYIISSWSFKRKKIFIFRGTDVWGEFQGKAGPLHTSRWRYYLMFMGPWILRTFQYGVRCACIRREINFLLTFETAPFFCEYPVYIQQDAKLHSLLYLETALHVSRCTSIHHPLLLLSAIAAGSSNGLTNTRYCRYSCMRSWWWVEVPPETYRAVSRYK
jgi:hypothetical protein